MALNPGAKQKAIRKMVAELLSDQTAEKIVRRWETSLRKLLERSAKRNVTRARKDAEKRVANVDRFSSLLASLDSPQPAESNPSVVKKPAPKKPVPTKNPGSRGEKRLKKGPAIFDLVCAAGEQGIPREKLKEWHRNNLNDEGYSEARCTKTFDALLQSLKTHKTRRIVIENGIVRPFRPSP